MLNMTLSPRSACLRIAAILLLPALASGCADQQPAAVPAAPAPAAISGPVPVDGTYVGRKQLISSADGPGVLCGTFDPIAITVTGRAFSYVLNQPEVPWQPTRTFNVTIDKDGSFQASAGPAHIQGHAGGGHMQGEIAGDACGYAFSADRPEQ